MIGDRFEEAPHIEIVDAAITVNIMTSGSLAKAE